MTFLASLNLDYVFPFFFFKKKEKELKKVGWNYKDWSL